MLIYFISCYHTKANHQHCCHHVRKRNCQYFSPGTLHHYFCWQGTNGTLFGSSLVFSLTAHSLQVLWYFPLFFDHFWGESLTHLMLITGPCCSHHSYNFGLLTPAKETVWIVAKSFGFQVHWATLPYGS